MDLRQEDQKRKEFCNILFELAKPQAKLQDAYYRAKTYERLESLYDAPSSDKPFRHFYSDIFSVLTQINQNSKLGDITILGQNLDIVRKGYKSQNTASDGHTIDVSDAIQKLYDHVNLDIARIMYSDGRDWKISGEEAITNLQSQIRGISNNQKNIESAQKNVETKISNQQKEYITILGIFAAVVLAFTGGIAFSTSVLENISHASAYRTIIISLIIGLILVNVLFGLFFYINKIVSKEEKLRPLVISNVVILCLIVITIIAWCCGWIELRDNRIFNEHVNSAAQIECKLPLIT